MLVDNLIAELKEIQKQKRAQRDDSKERKLEKASIMYQTEGSSVSGYSTMRLETNRHEQHSHNLGIGSPDILGARKNGQISMLPPPPSGKPLKTSSPKRSTSSSAEGATIDVGEEEFDIFQSPKKNQINETTYENEMTLRAGEHAKKEI